MNLYDLQKKSELSDNYFFCCSVKQSSLFFTQRFRQYGTLTKKIKWVYYILNSLESLK